MCVNLALGHCRFRLPTLEEKTLEKGFNKKKKELNKKVDAKLVASSDDFGDEFFLLSVFVNFGFLITSP